MDYIVTVNGKKLIDTRFLRSVMYGEGVLRHSVTGEDSQNILISITEGL